MHLVTNPTWGISARGDEDVDIDTREMGSTDPLRSEKRWRAAVARLRLRRCAVGAAPTVLGRVWVHGGGRVRIGSRVVLDGREVPVELCALRGAEIHIGDDVRVRPGASLLAAGRVSIGDRVEVGRYAKVLDCHYHALQGDRGQRPTPIPVTVDADVVLGDRSILLPGAHVRAGAKVAPGAVISRRGRASAENTSAGAAGNRRKLSPVERAMLRSRQVVQLARAWVLVGRPALGKLIFVGRGVRISNAGTLKIGDRVHVNGGMIATQIDCGPGATLEIGSDNRFSYGVYLSANREVRIGARCLLASLVRIADADEHGSGRIVIGNDVWIAHGATIRPGVSIGDGAVIGAGSIVTEDVPAGQLALGNPARAIPFSMVAQNATDRAELRATSPAALGGARHQRRGTAAIVDRLQSLVQVSRTAAPTLAYTLGAALAGVLGGVVLARTLGPALRGEFASIVAWASVLTFGGDLGIGYAASYYVAKDRSQASGLWTECMVFGLGIGGTLAIIAGVVLPRYLQLPNVTPAVVWLGFLAIPLMMAATHQGYLLLGAGYLRDVNLVRFSSPAAYGIGIATAALAGQRTVPVYMTVWFIAHLASFCCGAYFCRKRLAVKLDLSMPGVRALLKYGLKSQVGTIFSQVSLRMDQVLMSILLPSRDLGRYVVAVAVATALAPVFTASTLIVSRSVLSAKSNAEAGARITEHLKAVGVATSALVLVGIVACGWLVPRVFGASFTDAVPAARVLLVASLFQGFNIVLGAVLRNMGHPGWNSAAEFAGSIVTVGCLSVLLPAYGIIGAAISSLLAYSCTALLHLVLTMRASRVAVASE